MRGWKGENKLMAIEVFESECKGQMSINDLFAIDIPENLFAVSKIFARARKQMSLAELKTFVYCLTEIKWKEQAPNLIYLDKKTLANILGIHSDTNHLSVDVYDNIKDLPKHSLLEFADKDKDFFDTGFLINRVTMLKNRVRIKFDDEYLQLFCNLEKDYITMWSADIFSMKSERSVEFYEQLRLNTDTRDEINTAQVGIKWFKELFNIPKEGKGSYMNKEGHFSRTHFERYIIDPLCADLAKCKMINLVLQPNGNYYEKIKQNGRVVAYRFDWTYTSHPKMGTATEMQEVKKTIEENPEVLKIAKDIIKGTKKKNKFNSFENKNSYDMDELEKKIVVN
jgi:stalled ribosome alternative rescue factor ArfA